MIPGVSAIVDEPTIDTSLEHYMEGRALAIALAMAGTPEQQAKIEHLLSLRADLMERRQAHSKNAVAKGLGPSRQEMDAKVKGLYLEQGTSEDVLRVHARTHFASSLVSKRLGLALMPADTAQSAREMLAHEESFARAWIAAAGDPSFADQMMKMLWP